MIGFWLGFVLGLVATAPLAVLAMRYESRRVRRLERRARGAQRLAELGRLTSGLAHEIKNPLSTVGLNIQLLQEDLRDLSAHSGSAPNNRERIGRIQRRFEGLFREVQRLRDILEDFLRYAGRFELHRVPTDANALIEELVDFFLPQAQAAAVQLRTQFSGSSEGLTVDQSLLKQALLNLLINATQAMAHAKGSGRPHGGSDELMIRTERARAQGQEEFCIHVIDTGPGIEPENLEKIFQPYFSTKKQGTGLGLPTARRIAEEHGGSLGVHSELGRGTEFILALPIGPTETPKG